MHLMAFFFRKLRDSERQFAIWRLEVWNKLTFFELQKRNVNAPQQYEPFNRRLASSSCNLAFKLGSGVGGGGGEGGAGVGRGVLEKGFAKKKNYN